MNLNFEWFSSVFILAVSCIALTIAGWSTLKKGRVYALLIGMLAMYGFSILFSLNNELVDGNRLMAASVYAVGSIVLLMTIYFVEMLLPQRNDGGFLSWRQRIQSGIEAHAYWTLLAGIFSLALFVVTQQDFELTGMQTRSESGAVVVFATFLFMLSVPGVISGFLQGEKLMLVLRLIIAISIFLLSSSRAAMMGAVVYGAWLSLAQAKSRAARIRIVFILLFIAFIIHVLLRVIRGFGMLGFLRAVGDGTLIEHFGASAINLDLSGGEAAIVHYFFFAAKVASAETFGYLTSVVRWFTLFFPRELFPTGKPMDVTYLLWAKGFTSGIFDAKVSYGALEELFLLGSYGSLHATLFGELFLSGRWLSLLISTPVAGALCVFIDRSLLWLNATSALLLLGPVLIGMLMVARGNSVIGFGYFFYLAAIVVTVNWLVRTVRGKMDG